MSAVELQAIISRARQIDDPWAAVRSCVAHRRDLQFREPTFTDALLVAYPNSTELVALAGHATRATTELLERARRAGVVNREFATEDLYYADVANGLALRVLPAVSREDYDRRTRFFIDSMRAR